MQDEDARASSVVVSEGGPRDRRRNAGSHRRARRRCRRTLRCCACATTTRFDLRSGFFGRVERRVHAVEEISSTCRGERWRSVGESAAASRRPAARCCARPIAAAAWIGAATSRRCPRRAALVRREIQMIFQDPFASLDRASPSASRSPSRCTPWRRKGREAEKRVAWLLDHVGLAPTTRSAIRTNSPRTAAAHRDRSRAGAQSAVIVADEAVSALDVSIQAQIVNLMIDLQAEFAVYLFSRTTWRSSSASAIACGDVSRADRRDRPRRAVFGNPASLPASDERGTGCRPFRRRGKRSYHPRNPSPVRRWATTRRRALVEVGPGHFVATHRVGGLY